MARYTIKEFTEAVGLGTDRDSVTRSGIILKALCGLGIAKETGTKKHGPGRPAAVYEVPDPIVIPLGLGKVSVTVKEVVEAVAPVAVATAAVAVVAPPAPQGGYYDDDEDDD
jgi:hypothetical protein